MVFWYRTGDAYYIVDSTKLEWPYFFGVVLKRI